MVANAQSPRPVPPRDALVAAGPVAQPLRQQRLELGGMRLPRMHPALAPAWFWVACHGGAGSTTLAMAVPGGLDGGRYWPIPEVGAVHVVLVARSHVSGLRAAQAAAAQWASRRLPSSVRLLGLAVVADAPGRRPKPLRDLLDLVAGGFPTWWDLPWVEGLRLGESADSLQLPPVYAQMGETLAAMRSRSEVPSA